MTFPWQHLSLAQIDAIEKDRLHMPDPEVYKKAMRCTKYPQAAYLAQVLEHFKLVPRQPDAA